MCWASSCFASRVCLCVASSVHVYFVFCLSCCLFSVPLCLRLVVAPCIVVSLIVDCLVLPFVAPCIALLCALLFLLVLLVFLFVFVVSCVWFLCRCLSFDLASCLCSSSVSPLNFDWFVVFMFGFLFCLAMFCMLLLVCCPPFVALELPQCLPCVVVVRCYLWFVFVTFAISVCSLCCHCFCPCGLPCVFVCLLVWLALWVVCSLFLLLSAPRCSRLSFVFLQRCL